MARALATLLFVKANLFPLIIRPNEKSFYFDALEAADRGDDAPLIERFRAMQRREIVKMSSGLRITRDDNGAVANLDEVITRVSRKLEFAGLMIPAALSTAINALAEETGRQVDALAKRLTRVFTHQTGWEFTRASFNLDAVAVYGLRTEGLDYQPRDGGIHKTDLLLLNSKGPYRIVCSLHETGPRRNGLAACVVYLASYAENPAAVSPPSEYFLLTYAEPLPELQARFSKWLETQLITTLDLWQQQL